MFREQNFPCHVPHRADRSHLIHDVQAVAIPQVKAMAQDSIQPVIPTAVNGGDVLPPFLFQLLFQEGGALVELISGAGIRKQRLHFRVVKNFGADQFREGVLLRVFHKKLFKTDINPSMKRKFQRIIHIFGCKGPLCPARYLSGLG